jgi:hypothetical protein
VFDEPEELLSALLFLAPLVLGIAGVRVSGRGHWAGPVLGIPAILLGTALVAALFNNAAGPGVIMVLVYAPILLGLGVATIARWRRRRR